MTDPEDWMLQVIRETDGGSADNLLEAFCREEMRCEPESLAEEKYHELMAVARGVVHYWDMVRQHRDQGLALGRQP